MVHGPVLPVVSRRPLDLKGFTDGVHGIGVTVPRSFVESLKDELFILAKLLPCRDEPCHVLHGLAVAFLQDIDLIQSACQTLFPGLWIMGMRQAVHAGTSNTRQSVVSSLDLASRVPDDEIHAAIIFNSLNGPGSLVQVLSCNAHLPTSAFTASINADCDMSFCFNAFSISPSIVPFVTMCCTTTVPACCPWR